MSRRSTRGEVVVFAGFGVIIFGLVASVALFVLRAWDLEQARPWSIVEVLWAYGGLPPYAQDVGVSLAIGAVALLALLAVALTGARKGIFGDARFARRGELGRSRLQDPTGVLLGKVGGRFLCNDEPLHILACAPTRSGKGVGVVVPNIFAWEGSLVVLDIKGENFAITSGYRAKCGQVFKFSPMSTSTHRYNPLDAVRKDVAHRLSDLQQLAAILVVPPDRVTMWESEARDLFVAIALYVLDTAEVPHTLGEVVRTLKSDRDLADVIEDWLTTRSDLDPACVQALHNFRQKAVKERSGVKSTLTSALLLWSNPVIDAATSATDFDLGTLREKRSALYVVVPLGELGVLRPLLNLFFQQAIGVLAREAPTRRKYQVLLVLDEFASLGRMDTLADALPFLAGFGVRILTVVQALGQLEQLYGASGASTIVQNSALQLFFAANDQRTASYVSERLGFQTIKTTSRSVPVGFGHGSGSKSYAFTRRELMLPQEVRGLGADEALLLKEGALPVRARKIRYYDDPAFATRLLKPLAIPELVVERVQPRRFEPGQKPEAVHEVLSELQALLRESSTPPAARRQEGANGRG